jgi:Sulfate permease family
MTTAAGEVRPSRLARLVPALDWLGHYQRAWLRGDVVAALTTWALVVPQAIAYAQIAQLPPKAGLFAAFAALLGYGLFGTSRQLIVSPTSATAAISAALVAPVAMGDAARFGALSAALAVLVGVVLVVLGVLHLGFVSRFISAAVQAGFMFGLGLTIIVGQLPALLGVPKGEGNFFPQLWHVLTQLGDTNGWTASLGLGALTLLLGLKRAAPGVPAALVVVAAGIVGESLADEHRYSVRPDQERQDAQQHRQQGRRDRDQRFRQPPGPDHREGQRGRKQQQRDGLGKRPRHHQSLSRPLRQGSRTGEAPYTCASPRWRRGSGATPSRGSSGPPGGRAPASPGRCRARPAPRPGGRWGRPR